MTHTLCNLLLLLILLLLRQTHTLHTLPNVPAGVVARQAERTGSGLRIHLTGENLLGEVGGRGAEMSAIQNELSDRKEDRMGPTYSSNGLVGGLNGELWAGLARRLARR